jgi:hypothetical protein
MRNREELDTDAMRAERAGATRHKTERNRFEVLCAACGETYFVEEATARRIEEALGYDPSDTGFYCEQCESAYSDGERGM